MNDIDLGTGQTVHELPGDRVTWNEFAPGCWHGDVDGQHTYLALCLYEPGPDSFPVWIGRFGAKVGSRCTNIGRAMDLAEMNETRPLTELMKHGLALPVR